MTRADTVFIDLRQRIVEGDILTGSKLSEPELAKYYEISRSTLRDALSRLEGCGLLERKANIGYRVVTLSTEKLHNQHESLQQGQAYIQEEGDLDFHFRIVMGSGNKLLIRLLCEELYYLVRMYRYQFGMASPRAKKAFSEHHHIIQAIEDQDGELAEILMRRHISG